VTKLDNLAGAVRASLDRTRAQRLAVPSASDIRELVASAAGARRQRRQRFVQGIAGLSLAAAVALGVYVSARGPEQLSFVVGEALQNGDENHWIRTRGGETIPLEFSDGTSLKLAPDSRARVTELTSAGAAVALETGRLEARVVPRPGAAWSVIAGPYTVRVTGTEFRVSWEAEREVLEVYVAHGSVAVTGPVLAGAQSLASKQLLTVSLPERRAAISDGAPAAAPPAAAPGPSPSAGLSSEAPSEPSQEAPPSEPSPPPRSGFEQLLQTSSAEELLKLADDARMSGQGARASQALHSVRQRFPRSRAAGIAAYTLGITAFDQRGAYAEAARWFETYLREQPAGSLAREALGRQMEAADRAGQRARAQALAERYLKLYPAGPQHKIARRLVGP
jgi:TolA-binding protein